MTSYYYNNSASKRRIDTAITWTELSGAWTYVEGTDEVQCDTAGIIYHDRSQAYGTWQFDFSKDGSSTCWVMLMSDVTGAHDAAGQDGYFVTFTNSERVGLSESTNGSYAWLFYSANSYYAIDSWYSYKLTRTSGDDTFTLYIKGGIYGDWTVVSTSGGSGTNPVVDSTTTTSSYVCLELNAGDKIKNFIFTPE